MVESSNPPPGRRSRWKPSEAYLVEFKVDVGPGFRRVLEIFAKTSDPGVRAALSHMVASLRVYHSSA